MYDGHGLFLALLQRLPLTYVGTDYMEYTVDGEVIGGIRVVDGHSLRIDCSEDGITNLTLVDKSGAIIGQRYKTGTANMTLSKINEFLKKIYSKFKN